MLHWVEVVEHKCRLVTIYGDVVSGITIAKENSIDEWDGYYIRIAKQTGGIILTCDSDFGEVDGIRNGNLMTDEDTDDDLDLL